MKKKNIRLVPTLLAFLLLFSSAGTFAAEPNKALCPEMSLTYAFKLHQPTSEEYASLNLSYNYVSLWQEAFAKGYMTLNRDGLITLADDTYKLAPNEASYTDFVETIVAANYLLRVGLAEIQPDTFEIQSLEITQQALNKMREEPKIETTNIVPRAEPHDCGYPSLNVGKLCYDNWQSLDAYYMRMLQLSLTNPNLSPWGATVGFWIGKVQNGGDWDYKVVPGYSPYSKIFCCSYGAKTKQHMTSEWLGNYNYGYTGSYLFDLNTLKFGSSAVAGFDPADENDWPAITDGYNDGK